MMYYHLEVQNQDANRALMMFLADRDDITFTKSADINDLMGDNRSTRAIEPPPTNTHAIRAMSVVRTRDAMIRMDSVHVVRNDTNSGAQGFRTPQIGYHRNPAITNSNFPPSHHTDMTRYDDNSPMIRNNGSRYDMFDNDDSRFGDSRFMENDHRMMRSSANRDNDSFGSSSRMRNSEFMGNTPRREDDSMLSYYKRAQPYSDRRSRMMEGTPRREDDSLLSYYKKDVPSSSTRSSRYDGSRMIETTPLREDDSYLSYYKRDMPFSDRRSSRMERSRMIGSPSTRDNEYSYYDEDAPCSSRSSRYRYSRSCAPSPESRIRENESILNYIDDKTIESTPNRDNSLSADNSIPDNEPGTYIPYLMRKKSPKKEDIDTYEAENDIKSPTDKKKSLKRLSSDKQYHECTICKTMIVFNKNTCDHACIHTNLMRVGCGIGDCDYKAGYSAKVAYHIKCCHPGERPVYKRFELTAEEEEELEEMKKKCFPNWNIVEEEEPAQPKAEMKKPKVEAVKQDVGNGTVVKYGCTDCGRIVFGNDAKAKKAKAKHALTHMDIIRYKCNAPSCEFTTKYSTSIGNHQRNVHKMTASDANSTRIQLTPQQEKEIEDMAIKCYPELDVL